MLTGRKSLPIDVGVRAGDREVDDDVDIGPGEEVIGRATKCEAVFFGGRLSMRHIDVRAGGDLDDVGVVLAALEVGVGNITAANQADIGGSHF